MTEFISKYSDNLNSFASAVWGNTQAVLKRDRTTGVHYIDLTAYHDAFEFLLGSAFQHVKILVRVNIASHCMNWRQVIHTVEGLMLLDNLVSVCHTGTFWIGTLY